MAQCCVTNCSKEKYPGCGVSFHVFPTNVNMRQKWIDVIPGRLKNKRPYICGLHFKNDDFLSYSCAKSRLRPDAVPCIFPEVPVKNTHKVTQLNYGRDICATSPDGIETLSNDSATSEQETSIDMDHTYSSVKSTSIPHVVSNYMEKKAYFGYRCVLCGKHSGRDVVLLPFPNNVNVCRQWLKHIGMRELAQMSMQTLTSYVYLCDKHFYSGCFDNGTLRPTSVPAKDMLYPPLSPQVLADFPSPHDMSEYEEQQLISKPATLIRSMEVLKGKVVTDETLEKDALHSCAFDDFTRATGIEIKGQCAQPAVQLNFEVVPLPDVANLPELPDRRDTSEPDYDDTFTDDVEIYDEKENGDLRDESRNTLLIDDIDTLFLTYSRTFKTFSSKLQAMLKLDLAKLFARYETKHLSWPEMYAGSRKRKEKEIVPTPVQACPTKLRLKPVTKVRRDTATKSRKKISPKPEAPVPSSVAPVTLSAAEEMPDSNVEQQDVAVNINTYQTYPSPVVPLIVANQQPALEPLYSLQPLVTCVVLSKGTDTISNGGTAAPVCNTTAQGAISASNCENHEKQGLKVVDQPDPSVQLELPKLDTENGISLDPETFLEKDNVKAISIFDNSMMDGFVVDGADFSVVEEVEILDVGS